ncbi:MAG TPA: hypothetical protein VD791_11920 [Burkholderiales bacterium]|nr:hypothetical protein [Burkholderiales bacterium]
MTTASFESWAGSIADIGPIYPMVGSEVWLLIIGLVFWIGWHVIQTRAESRAYRADIERYGKSQTLRELLDKESRAGQ